MVVPLPRVRGELTPRLDSGIGRTGISLGDGPAPFHRIAELWFEDAEALEAAKDSPELEAAANDVVEMEARFGVTLHSSAGISVDADLGPYTPV